MLSICLFMYLFIKQQSNSFLCYIYHIHWISNIFTEANTKMNELKIQTLPQVIHSLTAKCAVPHTQEELQNAWINISLILAYNFWSNRHWPWCKFLRIHSVVIGSCSLAVLLIITQLINCIRN